MPYKITWAVDHRVLHLHLAGSVSYSEIEALNRHYCQYIDAGTQPVHVFLDVLSVTHYPLDVRWIAQIIHHHIPHNGWTLIITRNAGLQYLATTLFQLTRGKLESFSTFEEAQTFLRQNDATLSQQG